MPSTKSPVRRFLPILLLAAGLALFLALGGGRYISLDYLADRYGDLRALVRDHVVLAAAGFVLLYALLVAISVPGAASLTIAGGLLFGTLLGGSLTVVGATLGAVAVFLAARTAFAELLRQKAGPRVQKLREGFERDAFNYLLFLRLVPAFPFFLVNIAAGLFGMRTAPYALATFFGIMPGTFVFASIGAGAGAIIARGEDLSLGGVLTDPAVLLPILGLAALALLPVVLRRFRKRRARPAS
jgi:uncharacterized membrane protein YdjX (TVP38/TMEM64 family)